MVDVFVYDRTLIFSSKMLQDMNFKKYNELLKTRYVRFNRF